MKIAKLSSLRMPLLHLVLLSKLSGPCSSSAQILAYLVTREQVSTISFCMRALSRDAETIQPLLPSP